MSVNSVLPGLLPSYGPLSGNGSQNAKATARAKDFPEQTSVTADPSLVTGTEADGTARDTSTTNDGSSAAGPFQSTLEQALRQGQATAAASPSSTTSEAPSESPSRAIAAYQRVSQYGSSEPSTSALLKRWNNIMQTGSGTDGAAADFAKALAQNETPGLESGVLDLTA